MASRVVAVDVGDASGSVADRLAAILEQALAGPIGERPVSVAIETVRARLAAGVLRLGVAGRTQVGKTSLVEALLGRRVPSVDPEVAVVYSAADGAGPSDPGLEVLDAPKTGSAHAPDAVGSCDAVVYLFDHVLHQDELLLHRHAQALFGCRTAAAAVLCLQTRVDQPGEPAAVFARARERRRQVNAADLAAAGYVLPHLAAAARCDPLDGPAPTLGRYAAAQTDLFLQQRGHRTPQELRALWLRLSAFDELRSELDRRFIAWSAPLRAAQALATLRTALEAPAEQADEPAAALRAALDRSIGADVELRQLRLREALVDLDLARMTPPGPLGAALRELVWGRTAAARVGLPRTATAGQVTAAAAERAGAWRRLQLDPDPVTARHARNTVHLLEQIARGTPLPGGAPGCT